MKTLTTTLSIFALLLSTSAFSAISNEDIEPIKMPRDPKGIPVNFILTSNDIEPIKMPRDPGNIINNLNKL